MQNSKTDTWTLPKFFKKKHNWIVADVLLGRSAVKLTMVLKGEPQTWIEYNVEQLDELIRILQTCREDLR